MLSYGPHPSQYGVLYLPSTAGPWPVVVVLHGGFWRTAYGLDLGAPLAEDLAGHGIASWNLEYRRVGDDPAAGGGGWPGTCQDVAAGVDLLATDVQQAAEGRLDLSRVVAVGHSAGGHLAGWLASRATFPAASPGAQPKVKLTGFVSLAGVLDLALGHREGLGSGAVADFLGETWDHTEDGLALASPIDRIPTGIASVCVHGTADDVVPLNQSERFVAASVAAGDRARIVVVDGADHDALIDVDSPVWVTCRDAVLGLI